MTSPPAVARMIDQARQPMPRLGFVTAVAATAVTVRFADGSTTPSLQYATAYVPTVGDQVLVIPTTSAWVVTGKVSAAPSLVPDEEIVVASTSGWFLDRRVNFGPEPRDWTRYDNPGPITGWAQGRQIMPIGSTEEIVAQQMIDHATIGYYGSLASRVPSGSTITGVSLLWRRVGTGAPEPPLSSPVLYGHSYTTGSPPPVATPAFPFGPYRYPPVAMGETARLALPAALITAWLAGTVTGIAIWSDAPADAFNADARPADLAITYTPPA
ncbi:hypothetical protein JN535_04285 [Cellulosimicrobium cellulans]|uniref:hypothetical protein n=1 Tax=Cellulosimicrobium cellulans TaxID=1710 RepID=UPI001962BE5E|nr:hypothetical protein [Cellulosimicrobium cellulans]MBN0039393.1 hypothetical protein [Cellulosimicrobium cellulans]